MRAGPRETHLARDVSNRDMLETDPLDEQAPAMESQTSVSVGHEDLRRRLGA
jgi:hypothetical protein